LKTKSLKRATSFNNSICDAEVIGFTKVDAPYHPLYYPKMDEAGGTAQMFAVRRSLRA